jgi:hypothetical protein
MRQSIPQVHFMTKVDVVRKEKGTKTKTTRYVTFKSMKILQNEVKKIVSNIEESVNRAKIKLFNGTH